MILSRIKQPDALYMCVLLVSSNSCLDVGDWYISQSHLPKDTDYQKEDRENKAKAAASGK